MATAEVCVYGGGHTESICEVWGGWGAESKEDPNAETELIQDQRGHATCMALPHLQADMPMGGQKLAPSPPVFPIQERGTALFGLSFHSPFK